MRTIVPKYDYPIPAGNIFRNSDLLLALHFSNAFLQIITLRLWTALARFSGLNYIARFLFNLQWTPMNLEMADASINVKSVRTSIIFLMTFSVKVELTNSIPVSVVCHRWRSMSDDMCMAGCLQHSPGLCETVHKMRLINLGCNGITLGANHLLHLTTAHYTRCVPHWIRSHWNHTEITHSLFSYRWQKRKSEIRNIIN